MRLTIATERQYSKTYTTYQGLIIYNICLKNTVAVVDLVKSLPVYSVLLSAAIRSSFSEKQENESRLRKDFKEELHNF